MIIKKETPCLFLRIPSFYRNLDVIEEHLKVYKEKKEVWIMKMGKKPNEDFIKEIINKNGGIIFKKASKFGNNFYFGKLTSIRPNENNIVYPDYYNEIFNNMNRSLNVSFDDSVWFKVTDICELTKEEVDNFVTKKETSLYDAATHLFQVAYMYVSSKNEIYLKEVE